MVSYLVQTEINKPHYTLRTLAWSQYRIKIAHFDLTGDRIKPHVEHFKIPFQIEETDATEHWKHANKEGF